MKIFEKLTGILEKITSTCNNYRNDKEINKIVSKTLFHFQLLEISGLLKNSLEFCKINQIFL